VHQLGDVNGKLGDFLTAMAQIFCLDIKVVEEVLLSLGEITSTTT